MHEIDKETVGTFLACLRKEKGLTQKELAEKLFVSDKAVSKWERGLSMPDIALLTPLAALLGVTVTELLRGQHVVAPEQLNVQEVEQLVGGTIELSAQEQQRSGRQRRRRGLTWLCCLLLAAAEVMLLLALGFSADALMDDLLVVEGLCLCFGGWFCLFARETLPLYYDENKIHVYSDGVFRMNLPGVRFTNGNWPHILRVGRLWMLCVPVLYPPLYLALRYLLPVPVWEAAKLFVLLPACLGLFIPMVIVGRRYE